MRIKRLTLIGIAFLILSLIMQIGLFVSSRIGAPKDSPVVVMYGFDEQLFPYTSFGNAVRSSGFDYVILNKNLSKSLAIEEEISLPKGYRSREIVYLVQGEDATSALKLFDSDEDTLGFILLNPVFENNFSMEGMGVDYPTHDVAIFAGNEATNSDARAMYERLSSEDTLYGVKYETGGVFSSECFSNPQDNRFISISSLNYSTGNSMVTSPVFQIELANYLASNYGDGSNIGSAGIVWWYAIYVFSTLLFLSGMILVVAQILPLRFRTKSDINNKLRVASVITIGVVALLLVVGVILLMYIPKLVDMRFVAVAITPVILILCMALLRFVYVFKHREVKADDKNPSWYTWMISGSLVIVPFMIFIDTFGIENFKVGGITLLVIILAVAIDFVSVLILASADNITRLLGEGGCSYFGRISFVGFTAVPSLVALIVGAFNHIENGVFIGLFGLISVIVPYIFSMAIKKRTLTTLQVATVHSLLYLIILFLVA